MKKILIFMFVSIILLNLTGFSSNAQSVESNKLPTCSVTVYTPKTGNPYAIVKVDIPEKYKVSSKQPETTIINNNTISLMININYPHAQFSSFKSGKMMILESGWYGTKTIRVDSPVKTFNKGDSVIGTLKFTAVNGKNFNIEAKRLFN